MGLYPMTQRLIALQQPRPQLPVAVRKPIIGPRPNRVATAILQLDPNPDVRASIHLSDSNPRDRKPRQPRLHPLSPMLTLRYRHFGECSGEGGGTRRAGGRGPWRRYPPHPVADGRRTARRARAAVFLHQNAVQCCSHRLIAWSITLPCLFALRFRSTLSVMFSCCVPQRR